MPLKYLNRGRRDYSVQTIHPHRRKNWEFEIALEGALAPKLSEGGALEPESQTMWVFPPAVSHGWINAPKEWIEIMVFHCAPPLEPLRTYVEQCGYVGIPLDRQALKRLGQIFEEFSQNLRNPDMMTDLRNQRTYADFCILLLEQAGYNEPLSARSIAEARVENAIEWYSNNLQNQPSLEDAAAAVHISVPQLRRHFYDVRQQNPREVFQQIRFDRAIELLDQGTVSIESIALACGYGSLSAFSRAWKTHYGSPPRASRQ